MNIKRLLISIFLIGNLSIGFSQNLKVGAAVRIITPEPLLPISGGIGTPKAAQEKREIYLPEQWFLSREIPESLS